MVIKLEHAIMGRMPAATTTRFPPLVDPVSATKWVLSARVLVVVAILLEVQTPRLGDDASRLSIALFVVMLYALILHRIRSVIGNLGYLVAWPVAPLLGYTAWAALSAMWSPIPADSVMQAGILLFTVILAVSYADMPPMVLAREAVKVAAWVSALSWAMLAVAPSVAVIPDVTWRLNGIMQHEQRLALVSGMGIILYAALRLAGEQVYSTKFRALLAISLLVAALLATQTRANTVFVLIVLAVMVFSRMHVLLKMLFIGIGAWSSVWVAVNFESVLMSFDREGSNTATLSGRTSIWSNAISMSEQHPWLGYGFGSFYSPLTAHFFRDYTAPHAHNTWINAAFETGLVGAVLLTLFMLGGLLVGVRAGYNRYAAPMMFFASLCGLMGVVFGGKISTFWVIITVMVVQVAKARRDALHR